MCSLLMSPNESKVLQTLQRSCRVALMMSMPHCNRLFDHTCEVRHFKLSGIRTDSSYSYQTMLLEERNEKGPNWHSTVTVSTRGPLLRVDSLRAVWAVVDVTKVCYLDIAWHILTKQPEAKQINVSFTQRRKESFDLERGGEYMQLPE